MNRLVVLVVLSVCCLCAFQFVLLLWNRDAAEPPLPRFAVPSRAWSTRPRPPRPVLNSRSRPRASQPLAISLMIASDMDKESRVNGSGKARAQPSPVLQHRLPTATCIHNAIGIALGGVGDGRVGGSAHP